MRASWAVATACGSQLDLALETPGQTVKPETVQVDLGSSIALTTETEAWQLAVMVGRADGETIARSLFAMERGEFPEKSDQADALGEIVSVAAGLLKSQQSTASAAVRLGVPLFLEGGGCLRYFASGVRGLCSRLQGGNGLQVYVVIIWQEG